jgi:hypothetical protein
MIGALFSHTAESICTSERRKLSVEANISLSLSCRKNTHASIGRSHPSAVEKRVFSIADFTSEVLILVNLLVGIPGITGNFSAESHLNFVSLLFV